LRARHRADDADAASACRDGVMSSRRHRGIVNHGRTRRGRSFVWNESCFSVVYLSLFCPAASKYKQRCF